MKVEMVWFEVAIFGLYILGLVMSLAFVFTWYPLAFRALAHHRADVSLARIIDYAGLHLFVAVAYALTLRTAVLYGLTPPQDGVAGFARIFLPLGIDVLVGLRLYKWGTRLWENRHGGRDAEALQSVSRGSWRPDDDVVTPGGSPLAD